MTVYSQNKGKKRSICSRCLWMDLEVELISYNGCSQMATLRIVLLCGEGEIWPACHIYDSSYCKVMTIPVCDMQTKGIEGQIIF